jgi:hypothetical protein
MLSEHYLEEQLLMVLLMELLGSMSNFYDFAKEYCYWFFDSTEWLRPMILVPTAVLGVMLYLPFDNIKVRYHTMTPLPNCEMPYKSYIEAIIKSNTNLFMNSIFNVILNNNLVY